MRFDWDQNPQLLQLLRRSLGVVDMGMNVHERGIRLAERYQFAIYDAMIASAALECGCDTLYSEDMQHGLVVDGRLTIDNPFRQS